MVGIFGHDANHGHPHVEVTPERLAYETERRRVCRAHGVSVHFLADVKDAYAHRNSRLPYLAVVFHVQGSLTEVVEVMRQHGYFVGADADCWKVSGLSFDGRLAVHTPVLRNSPAGWEYAFDAEKVFRGKHHLFGHGDAGFMVETQMCEVPAPINY